MKFVYILFLIFLTKESFGYELKFDGSLKTTKHTFRYGEVLKCIVTNSNSENELANIGLKLKPIRKNPVHIPLSSDQNCFSFHLKGSGEIMINSSRSLENPEHMIILNHFDKEFYRRLSFITDYNGKLVQKETPGLLHPNEFRGFWMRWNKTLLEIGLKNETNSFLKFYNNFDEFRIQYLSLSGLNNSDVEWIIDDKPSCAVHSNKTSKLIVDTVCQVYEEKNNNNITYNSTELPTIFLIQKDLFEQIHMDFSSFLSTTNKTANSRGQNEYARRHLIELELNLNQAKRNHFRIMRTIDGRTRNNYIQNGLYYNLRSMYYSYLKAIYNVLNY